MRLVFRGLGQALYEAPESRSAWESEGAFGVPKGTPSQHAKARGLNGLTIDMARHWRKTAFLRRFEAPHSLREQRGASSRGPVHLVHHSLRVSVTSTIGQLAWTPRWCLGHRARLQCYPVIVWPPPSKEVMMLAGRRSQSILQGLLRLRHQKSRVGKPCQRPARHQTGQPSQVLCEGSCRVSCFYGTSQRHLVR